jgi:hypothetical protein
VASAITRSICSHSGRSPTSAHPRRSAQASLNDFLARGRRWRDVREVVGTMASAAIDTDLVVRRDQLQLQLPVAVGDYVDIRGYPPRDEPGPALPAGG